MHFFLLLLDWLRFVWQKVVNVETVQMLQLLSSWLDFGPNIHQLFKCVFLLQIEVFLDLFIAVVHFDQIVVVYYVFIWQIFLVRLFVVGFLLVDPALRGVA